MGISEADLINLETELIQTIKMKFKELREKEKNKSSEQKPHRGRPKKPVEPDKPKEKWVSSTIPDIQLRNIETPEGVMRNKNR